MYFIYIYKIYSYVHISIYNAKLSYINHVQFLYRYLLMIDEYLMILINDIIY